MSGPYFDCYKDDRWDVGSGIALGIVPYTRDSELSPEILESLNYKAEKNTITNPNLLRCYKKKE
jgi:hypothetical protein